MVSGFAIATIVVFILSIIFVIRPVHVHIRLPFRHEKKIVRFPIDLLTAPITAIAILWAAQCLGASTIRAGIVGTDGVKPYNILILFFSLAYMSITLDITGVLKAAAYWVSNKSGQNGWMLFINFYIMVTLLSAVLGNDPVILSGTIFLLYYTDIAKLDELPWLMSEFAAANTASMVLFVGNPTNVVICEGFLVQNAAFTAYTILPFLGCSVTCLIALFVQFRMSGKLVKELPKTERYDVRQALTDPVGAWVGSVLLGGCLIVALVVSFVRVDVWKITLPFAAAKFFFDIAWDHYRYVNDKMPGSLPISRDGTLYEPPYTVNNPMDLPPPSYPSTRTPTDDTIVESGAPVIPDVVLLRGIPGPHHQVLISHEGPLTWQQKIANHFPTLYNAFPRLPFALVPFAFSQFILIEALTRQGWIDIFARWFIIATDREMFAVIWLMGVLGVILCNISGTNIGATILLTKVARAARLPGPSDRAAAIALAVASNIGAVSFVFSASLAGLLWKQIINDQKPNNKITQWTFTKWNVFPLFVMTSIGLGVVSAEMAVLYH
ncbi:hypothetical protein AMATHDRAFT_6158 [Amanita thiersii Skay4041]|uniref:Citrate transporter-like domain-containing protein n=1 Tax=Amanita thiersii Skay4041 TaxID=703135 RepID=A0A2A9NK35_9AGAR|nr:hypothetical protein AMATHDRAFT_6158 [Amanita thiersii Skay4041]